MSQETEDEASEGLRELHTGPVQGGGQEAREYLRVFPSRTFQDHNEIFAASTGFLRLKTIFEYIANFFHVGALRVHSSFPSVFSKMFQNVSWPQMC